MPTVRPETPLVIPAIREVNRLAFGRDDEGVLVDALRDGGHGFASLVADDAGRIVGHIFFSRLPVEAGGRVTEAAALAPMAVALELVAGALKVSDAAVRFAPPFGIGED